MNQLFALVFFTLFTCCNIVAQVTDTTAREQEEEEVIIIQNFAWKHRQRLNTMRRVYPLALSAKILVDAHQEELEGITKKRKRKKLGKKTHKKLKEEFNYNIRDLYGSEGELLIRLVHRETGMTVAEIIELFEGKSRRKWYNGMAKLGGQDLESEYDPNGEDYLTELIIDEIETGVIPFSIEAKHVDKTAYKIGMEEYRSRRKAGRKNRRRSKRKK